VLSGVDVKNNIVAIAGFRDQEAVIIIGRR